MADLEKFLEQIKEKTSKEFKREKHVSSFEDFLEFTLNKPQIVLRTSYQYIYDAILHFGTEEIDDCGEKIKKYKLFEDPFDNGNNEVFGTWRALNNIVNEIRSSAKEEGNERIVMLRGPVGTAKTTIVDLIANAIINYSHTNEGKIFRYYWQFRPEKVNKKSIGFIKNNIDDGLNYDCDGCSSCSSGSCSSAMTKVSNDILVPCQINEHPLYLIVNKSDRLKFLEMAASSYKERTGKDILIPKKLVEGSLCYNCQQLYEELLKKYNGDLDKVLGHVKIERYTIGPSRGIVDVTPDSRQDLNQKIRMYANELSRIFPRIDFISMFGRWAESNRGMIHLSDIFKTSDSHNVLLDAAEKHRINMSGVRVNIDAMIIGTSNIQEYQDVNAHKYSDALMDRTKKIDVGYILNVDEEKKIYERDIKKVSKNKHIAPHTIELAALWAVLTRLSKPIAREETTLDEEQIEYLYEIDPLEKVEIYRGLANYQFEYIEDHKKRLIDDNFRKELRRATNPFLEMGIEFMEEGNYGVSPRRIQNVFKMILEGSNCLNPLKVINELERILKEDRDFFKHLELEKRLKEIAEQNSKVIGSYYDSDIALIYVVNEYYKRVIAREVKFAFLGVKEEDLDYKVEKYIENIQKEKIYSVGKPIDDKIEYEYIDYMEGLFESAAALFNTLDDDKYKEFNDETKEEFRQLVIASIAEYDNLNPDAKGRRNLRKALPFVYKLLELALFEEKKTYMDLENIQRGLETMGTPYYDNIEGDTKEKIDKILSTMKERYGYCDTCSRAITLYALKENLLNDDYYD